MSARFKSGLAAQLDAFVRYREASGRWNESSYGPNLRLFDAHVADAFPGQTVLTQEIVDSWCRKRPSEGRNSCISRSYVVVSLVRFLRERGLAQAVAPELPRRERRLYVPHHFTDDELAAFFAECDSYEPHNFRTARHLCKKYTLPVFFRLLYSSGIRTGEARLLRVENVDLDAGVLRIAEGKGHDERYVALHESMAALMAEYDAAVSGLYPGRAYFFPCGRDGHHDRTWVQVNFKELWSRVSGERATAYELRHHYAVENINRLLGRGISGLDDLVYVSRSMGHASVDSTASYYYSLVPAMAGIMQERSHPSDAAVIPEVVGR